MRITSLSGDWTLNCGDEGLPIHAVVPGVVQTDMISAGRLEDPVLSGNLNDSYALSACTWRYSRSFILPTAGSGERFILVCEGLEAFASVYVNSVCVGKTFNAFRTWKFDITENVRRGSNKLEIVFKPKEHSAWTRTIPSPAAGIWRAIYIKSVGAAAFSDISVRQIHREDMAELNAEIGIDAFGGAPDLTVRAELFYKGSLVSEFESHVGAVPSAKIKLDVRNPQLWWPRTMGEQPLYELNFTLLSGGEVLDTWSRRIGFRTVSIVTEGEGGSPDFRLCVNGVPLRIAGVGWGLVDIFPSRPTRVEYSKYIKSVRVANMNLIRVRGSGTYEHDHFYDLCDELGILVWQDMLFSGEDYPLDDAGWRENALAEIRDNVCRLSSHACLALWCGNDELPLRFSSDSDSAGPMTRSAYREFFGGDVRSVVSQFAPGIPYLESSVSEDGLIRRAPELCRKSGNEPPAIFYSSFGVKSLSDSRGMLDAEASRLLRSISAR